MTTNLCLEAFGQLDTRHTVIVTAAEDLYSTFRDHAELMGWSASGDAPHPLLWNMHEAEITAAPGQERIGWAQVGLAFTSQPTRRRHHRRGWAPWPVDHHPVVASNQVVPALCQCLYDALQRFGTVTLTGLQLTVYERTDRPVADLPGDNWFHLTTETQVSAVLSLDRNWLGNARTRCAQLQRKCGAHIFKDVMPTPERYQITRSGEVHPQTARKLVPVHYGIEVTLPEWTVKALGWAMACAMCTAPAKRPYALRITRLS